MKTYLVVTESVFDYETNHKYQSFVRKLDAESAFKAEKAEIIKQTPDYWITDDDYLNQFAMYEDGYYAQNHNRVELLEVETTGYIDLMVSAVKQDEEEQFKLAVRRKQWKEGWNRNVDYFDIENRDEEYVSRPCILCNTDCGPIDLLCERITRNGDYYEIEGHANDGSGEYTVSLDDVACGHLSYLTEYL